MNKIPSSSCLVAVWETRDGLEPISKFIIRWFVYVGPAPRGERIVTGIPAYSRRGAGPTRTNQSAQDPEMSDPVILR